jgi:hypothetical protein
MLKVIDRPADDRRTLDKKRIARPRLSMVWVLDAATGKPVGHWVVEVSEPAVGFASAA